MNPLNEQILQSFDVISLILVFAFVLFDVRYQKIEENLSRVPPPPSLKNEFAAYKRATRISLLLNALPLVAVYGVVLFLFAPLASQVLVVYRPSLWDFDFIQTAFLFVILLIACFFVWSLVLGIRLLARLWRDPGRRDGETAR